MNAGELTYDFAQANSAVAAGPRAAGGSLRKARVPATSMGAPRFAAGPLISSSTKVRAAVSVRPSCAS